LKWMPMCVTGNGFYILLSECHDARTLDGMVVFLNRFTIEQGCASPLLLVGFTIALPSFVVWPNGFPFY
jgi:hypothetical protein